MQKFNRDRISSNEIESSSISLSEAEETFRRLLIDVVEFIQKKPISATAIQTPASLSNEPLELRWTGGWVRDKLLKKDSHDIDVAINKMTGYEFGLRLKEYLDISGNEKKYKVQGDSQMRHKLSRIAKIEANPEKSKHLETATTKIFGLDVDLVNLRKETYSDHSRNPQMEFGTPEEDAMRRDATINAMFYNIQTSKVEDFTGKGFDDLKDGIIRTPLEPHTTFIDDPLRVLRLVRFASRFGYQIEEKTLDAMKNKDIKDALMLKISRERVLVELEKMLKGPDPRKGLELIDSIGLYSCVFVEPSQPDFYTPDLTNWRDSYDTLSQLLEATESESGAQLSSILIRGKEDEYLAWILAAMVPYSNSPKIRTKKGKKMEHMIVRVAREGLKLPSRIIDILSSSNDNMDQIKQFVLEKTNQRDRIGMAIRQWGPTWRLQTLFAILHEIYLKPRDKISIFASFQQFLDLCWNLNILNAYEFKPLLDGTALAKALDTRPGPWMKEALDVVMAWQLRNPNENDANAVVSELQSWKRQVDDETKQAKHVEKKHNHSPAPKDGAITKKQKQGELTSALISHFLHLTLRPIFSQKQHPDLTATGRRNINAIISRKSQTIDLDGNLPLWKGNQSWARDLLFWTCRNLDSAKVESEWGVLVPPILNILDSVDVEAKTTGCELLKLVLDKTPHSLLARIGLAPVFEESLYTCTTYLPSFTPPADSAAILSAALPTLLSLANVANPTPSSSQTKFLLTILRKGFLAPMNHASEHVIISQVLYNQLPAILKAIGIDCVIHLKDLIPMISGTLNEPLGTAYPPLLLSAAIALRALIIEARPRASFWRVDILKGVCGLWVRIHPLSGEDGEASKLQMKGIKDECRAIIRTLDEAVTDEDWTEEDIRESWPLEVTSLIEADERLEPLFVDICSTK